MAGFFLFLMKPERRPFYSTQKNSLCWKRSRGRCCQRPFVAPSFALQLVAAKGIGNAPNLAAVRDIGRNQSDLAGAGLVVLVFKPRGAVRFGNRSSKELQTAGLNLRAG